MTQHKTRWKPYRYVLLGVNRHMIPLALVFESPSTVQFVAMTSESYATVLVFHQNSSRLVLCFATSAFTPVTP